MQAVEGWHSVEVDRAVAPSVLTGVLGAAGTLTVSLVLADPRHFTDDVLDDFRSRAFRGRLNRAAGRIFTFCHFNLLFVTGSPTCPSERAGGVAGRVSFHCCTNAQGLMLSNPDSESLQLANEPVQQMIRSRAVLRFFGSL